MSAFSPLKYHLLKLNLSIFQGQLQRRERGAVRQHVGGVGGDLPAHRRGRGGLQLRLALVGVVQRQAVVFAHLHLSRLADREKR